jgi:hypothetical protein
MLSVVRIEQLPEVMMAMTEGRTMGRTLVQFD